MTTFFTNLFGAKDKDKEKEKSQTVKPNVNYANPVPTNEGDMFSGMTLAPAPTQASNPQPEPQETSAFGFMSNVPNESDVPEEIPTNNDDGGSAFGFLNENSEAQDPPPDSQTLGGSSFTFLNEDSSNFPPPPSESGILESYTPSNITPTTMDYSVIDDEQQPQRTLQPQATKGKKVIKSKRPGQAAKAVDEETTKINKPTQEQVITATPISTTANSANTSLSKYDTKNDGKSELNSTTAKPTSIPATITPIQMPKSKEIDKNSVEMSKKSDPPILEKNEKKNDTSSEKSLSLKNQDTYSEKYSAIKNGQTDMEEPEDKPVEIPAPATSASTSENVERRMNSVWDVVQKWQSQVDNINEKQINMLVEKKEKYLKLIELTKRRNEQEVIQTELLENENYEEADEITEKIEKIKTEMREIHDHVISVSRQWLTLEDSKREIIDKAVQVRKEGINDLKELETEQTQVVADALLKFKEETQDEDYKIGMRERTVEKNIEHVGLDLSSLEEKDSQIQKLINDRTNKQRAERQIWVDKKKKVTAEIDELMARVQILRKEEQECTEKIDTMDQDINSVKNRYKQDLASIAADRTKLNADKTKYLNQKAAIGKEREAFIKKREMLKQKAEKATDLLKTIENAISSSRDIIKQFDKKAMEIQEQKASLENALDEEIKEYDKIKDLHTELEKIAEECESLASKKLQFQRKIRNLEQSIKTAEETTLPNLNNEKEIAAKKHRNFKAAKALQEEIKILKDTIEGQQKEKEESEQLLTESSEEFDRRQAEKVAMEEHVKEKEREIDMSHLEKVKNRITDMRTHLRKLQLDSSSNEAQTEVKRQEMLLEIERAKVLHVHAKYEIPLEPEPQLPLEKPKLLLDTTTTTELIPQSSEQLIDTTTETYTTTETNTTTDTTTTEPENSGGSLMSMLLEESPNPSNEESSFNFMTEEPTSGDTENQEIPQTPSEIPQIDEKEVKRRTLQEKLSEISNLEAKISEVNGLIENAVENEDFDKAEELDALLDEKKSQLQRCKEDVNQLKQEVGDEQPQ